LVNPADWPPLADVPPAGATVEAGWPILTVFANGSNETTVLESLQARVAEIQAPP
jgi:predicted ATP-grasp superfamily ATP-dependent carboligase